MMRVVRLVAVFAALMTAVVGCSSGSAKNSSGTSKSPSSNSTVDFKALGGWDDGACDSTQPKVEVSIAEPIDVAGVSLRDYVDGTQAAVDAFNARGGIKTRCLDLKVCDTKADGPTELACARSATGDAGIVAGLASSYIVGEADAYQLFESAGLSQVGAQVTMPAAWNSPVSFEFTMGGSGSLLSGIPALKTVGVTKFAILLPQSGQTAALRAFGDPLIKALGMDLVDIIEIPPTAVEFTQFVLAAQKAGAEGVVLALPQNVLAQVIDAMDAVSSPLKTASGFGDQKTAASWPDQIAANAAFSDAVPPVATDTTRWPILDVILDDFRASGKATLNHDNVTSLATQGWLSVYALIKVMRDSGATETTRATVKQAFDQATNVPMFDLIPPWTPSKQSTNAIFKGISNPNYWTGHWDSAKKEYVVNAQQADIVALLG